MKNYQRLLILVIAVSSFSQCNYIATQNALYELQDAMDIENPVTRKFAIKLASEFPGDYNVAQICKVYNYLYSNWKYVNDPRGVEYFSKASETINNNLAGDCDDFAILIATMIESIGGTARISFVSGPSGGHAFTEVKCGGTPDQLRDYINNHFQGPLEYLLGITKVEQVNYRKDPVNGYWLNLDYTSKYPGGEYFKYTECVIFYPTDNKYTSE